VIIEIGPGTGAITRQLASSAGFLYAIEADTRLVAQLKADLESGNFVIVEGDALSVDWDGLIDSGVHAWMARTADAQAGEPAGSPRVRIVGNLPYYISTPLLQVLMARHARIWDVTVMLQNEVVDRIASPPGSRAYGYLSILVQFYCEVEKLFEVPPSAFKPAPEVRSAVIKLRLRRQPAVAVESEERYLAVVRAAFAQRRKTILNNLKAAARVLVPTRPLVEALEQAGIDPRRRAETLSLQDFATLCDALYPGIERGLGG
jgi:16S rRNA (adenine1518-N6/adenine1519-N6)-dimethyltransferase